MAFDNLTRQLYATDASIYQIEPVGVAFPRTATEAAALVQAAAEAEVTLIPRGAGTGLAGGAIGPGLVVDLARHLNRIQSLDLEKRIVRVEPGVVLDQLNAFLQPHGYCFGPDVATSSRATLGGMIANNSSGARTPYYGTTADHVQSLDVLLPDGRIEHVEGVPEKLRELQQKLARRVAALDARIAERMPAGLLKRWPGYALDRLRRDPANLVHLFCGSEGTLGAIVGAALRIVPRPTRAGLALIYFDSAAEAMQATVNLLDLQPTAIEHVDRLLFDQTRGQARFQPARDLMGLDHDPCESILIVEFYPPIEPRLAEVERRRLGKRTQVLTDPQQMNLVWTLRKAGLSLLTGRPGPAKPVTGIEDTAVRPEQLPDYVAGLRKLLDRAGLQASFYGHAAAGLLHVRPILDLHRAEDVRRFRELADEVSALVRQFGGSIAAEHGVGMARSEYLEAHLGPELLELMREVKQTLDPASRFNPGKVLPDPSYRIDTHLRWGPGYALSLPFEPVLAFAAKDGSFVGNLEQCNGCGGCRKATPTMCPTFIATGDELMSTRGRANLIRAVLEGRGLSDADRLRAPELEAALDNCLACKACSVECPSNVNLALLKAELLHARHRQHGMPLRARLISAVDLLGRLGCMMPRLSNALLRRRIVRQLFERCLGLAADRPLPPFALERFDRWFARHRSSVSVGHPVSGREFSSRGRPRVILWDDCFVRYHEPHIGQAAVRVLEAAGYEVLLPTGRLCCGRPAFSQGCLDKARALGRHNLELLRQGPDAESGTPIVFLEPSCWAMFAEDYRELKLDSADAIAARCFLFETFLERELTQHPERLRWRPQAGRVAIHAHCHAKTLADIGLMASLARRLPEREVQMLDTGCCGMAGAFGLLKKQAPLSRQVAEPLVRQIHAQPAGTLIVASGTSCRHQIADLTFARPIHMAELLADALAEDAG